MPHPRDVAHHTSDIARSTTHDPVRCDCHKPDKPPFLWTAALKGMLSIHQTSTKRKRSQEKDTGKEEEVVNHSSSS
jgi:hypothetical protein